MPYPVKNFLVFPNPALYFGQIPDSEDNLQGTVSDSLLASISDQSTFLIFLLLYT